jgi:HD-like signal output (HDOD) protein
MSSPDAPRNDLEELIKRIDQISTLPHIVSQVTQVANATTTSAADLTGVIETAPALSARLLKCVNSAAYGLPNRINRLQHAISYLGFKQVCNLAIGAAVSEIFKGDARFGAYTRIGLWRHLVSVAVTSRMIATRCGMDEFEDAFLAGLLHDIGIILEDQYMNEPFGKMMENIKENQSLVHAEQEWLGFDHTELGERVAETWRLPEFVRVAIRLHHKPGDGYTGPNAQLLACVELANALCTLKDISSIGLKRVKISSEVLTCLGLGRDDMSVITEDMDRELKQHRELLDLVDAA